MRNYHITVSVISPKPSKLAMLVSLTESYRAGLQAGLDAIRRDATLDWRARQQIAQHAARTIGLPSEYSRVAGYRACAIYRGRKNLADDYDRIDVGARSLRIAKSFHGRWIARIATLEPRATVALLLRVPDQYVEVMANLRAGRRHGDSWLLRSNGRWRLTFAVQSTDNSYLPNTTLSDQELMQPNELVQGRS